MGEVLREERRVEVGPRDRRLDRRERDALGRRTPDRPAAVRVAERADALAVDARLGGEPVEELPDVLDLAWAVDRDEPLGLPVAAGIEGQYRVALRRELRLDGAVERHPQRAPRVGS